MYVYNARYFAYRPVPKVAVQNQYRADKLEGHADKRLFIKHYRDAFSKTLILTVVLMNYYK